MLCGDQPWVWVKGGKKKTKSKGAANDDKETTKNDTATPSNDDTSPEADATASNDAEGFSESTPRQLAQFHLTVTAKLRLSTLVAFLVQRVCKGERTVVFMGTCASVDYHYELFAAMESLWENNNDDDEKAGLFGTKAQVYKLHGSVVHAQRHQTLKRFDDAKSAILLTTDVSARGLNLQGVDWIIQYDPPCELSDYVHRVGRVCRAGKAGHSLLFLLPSERGYLDILQTKGISTLAALSLASTLNQAASLCPGWTNSGLTNGGSSERKGKVMDSKGTRLGEYFSGEVQRRFEDYVVQEDIETRNAWKEKTKKERRKNHKDGKKEGRLLELARNAFMSFLRAYSTKKEPSVRSIFSARALHLGHVARSFALKDPPKSLVSKQRSYKNSNAQEDEDEERNKPRALEFSKLDENLVRHNFSDDDGEGGNEARPAKRRRFQQDGKGKNSNAKKLLLANAMKMQSNLMDAM
jgi:ATP-dependent RNA helicase DDX31/DBP7